MVPPMTMTVECQLSDGAPGEVNVGWSRPAPWTSPQRWPKRLGLSRRSGWTGLSSISPAGNKLEGNAFRVAMRKWKYVPSPAIDELIRTAYEKQRLGDRLALTAVSCKLGWPRYSIAKRGAELGITRIKERVWSEREEEILHRYGHLPISSVQKRLALSGFERSCAAVQVK